MRKSENYAYILEHMVKELNDKLVEDGFDIVAYFLEAFSDYEEVLAEEEYKTSVAYSIKLLCIAKHLADNSKKFAEEILVLKGGFGDTDESSVSVSESRVDLAFQRLDSKVTKVWMLNYITEVKDKNPGLTERDIERMVDIGEGVNLELDVMLRSGVEDMGALFSRVVDQKNDAHNAEDHLFQCQLLMCLAKLISENVSDSMPKEEEEETKAAVVIFLSEINDVVKEGFKLYDRQIKQYGFQHVVENATWNKPRTLH